MVVRVGIVGDVHLSENTPRSWKADYPSVTLNELVTVMGMSDVTIVLGDLMHRPVVSEQYKIEVSRRIQETGKKLYTIWGNHDVEGLNLLSADRTSLNLLHEFGVIEILEDRHEFGGVVFDVIKLKKGPEIKKYEGEADGILLGHYFFEEASDPGFSLNRGELFSSGYKYVFLGHEHEPKPDIEGNGTTLIRQGSLCRNSAHDYNMNRIPVINILCCEGGKIVQVERNVPVATVESKELFRHDLMKSPVRNTSSLLTSMSELLERFVQSDSAQSNVLTVKKALVDMGAPLDVLSYIEDVYTRLGLEFK